ncbi:MAG: ATP-binding protein [Gammaproteobacteria bacterium]|jgi:predicted AAA+ superfamily ATPase
MPYTHRVLETSLNEYVDFFSVIGITGPRQSGKSTMLLHSMPNYQYVTFDDYQTIDMFQNDPERFMRIYNNKIIFDEVQKAPEIFNYIKIAVDNDRANHGKFILTGSSQFNFVKGITETLAGRIGLLTLLPYQFNEIPNNLHDDAIVKGCYPELVEKKYKLFKPWYSSYLETYLTKDVKTLSNIGNIRDFRRLISLLAANTGQLMNFSHYANDLGVDVKTIKQWISILEASYIIFLLPPYYNNYGKRIVKSPKIFFYDTGIVSYLTGIENTKQLYQGPMAGSLFENYIISEILKRKKHNDTHTELFYYRTTHGIEIDLIIDYKTHRDLFEIKSGETFHPRMIKAIEDLLKPNDHGYLLYNGKDIPYTEQIKILNYKNYLKKTKKS